MKNTTIFLIQLLLWLSIAGSSIIGISPAAAMMPKEEIQAVQTLEDSLFAIHYDQDPISSRLSRLEETVFGQAQSTTSVDARIAKLQGALSRTALGPLSPTAAQSAKPATQSNAATLPSATQPTTTAGNSIASTSGTQSIPGRPFTPNASAQTAGKSVKTNTVNTTRPPANAYPGKTTAAIPEPGETDYPTVSQMELKTFGKTFPKEDITNRLNRLENQVFKMPQTGSLADRTDNLRLVVLGDAGQGAPNITYGPASMSPNYTGSGQPDPNLNNGSYNAGYNPGYAQGYNPGYTQGNAGYPQPPNYGGQGNYSYPPANPMPGYNNGTPMAQSGSTSSIGYSMPNTGSTNNPMPGYGNASPPVATPYPTPSANANNAATPDMLAAMNEVEKEVLGTTYAAEPINTRLDRVENRVFKTTSPDLSSEDRIQRVIAVASAGGAPMSNRAKTKATLQTLLPIILTLLPLILL